MTGVRQPVRQVGWPEPTHERHSPTAFDCHKAAPGALGWQFEPSGLPNGPLLRVCSVRDTRQDIGKPYKHPMVGTFPDTPDIL